MPPLPAPGAADARSRNLLYFGTPALWPAWPFLPLVRRNPGAEEEYGVLYDCFSVGRVPGFSCTVFLTLCGTPHKVSYADWLIGRSLLDVPS